MLMRGNNEPRLKRSVENYVDREEECADQQRQESDLESFLADRRAARQVGHRLILKYSASRRSRIEASKFELSHSLGNRHRTQSRIKLALFSKIPGKTTKHFSLTR